MKRVFCSLSFSLLIVWGVSIFLGSHPTFRVNDPQTGLQLPAKGSVVTRFTEGCGVSRYGTLGLNSYQDKIEYRNKPFFLLHGDSFVEALQVSDENKPDAVLTRSLSNSAVAYGVGRSGYGFPSMIGRAIEYEKALGYPKAHIFFCASGISNDVFEDGGDEVEKKDGGFCKRVVPISQRKLLCSRIVNLFHLNFVTDVAKKLYTLNGKYGRILQPVRPNHRESQKLEDELNYILNSMKTQLHSPVIIVYCPNIPRIKKGVVCRDNYESDDAKSLRNGAEARGIGFIDLTDVLLDLFDRKSIVARGFPNLGGPGFGHLNQVGIDTVFNHIANYLKETYAL